MKNGWMRLCIILAVLGLLYGVACSSWQVKRQALDEVYQTVQFSLTKVEAQQYVNQIEYGMQYGKQLTSFFKMDELLRAMHMSSSYLQGVYVVDRDMNTVNSSTGTILPPIDAAFTQTVPGISEALTNYGVTYIALNIEDETEEIAGFLVLKLNTDAGGSLLESDWNESWLRTLLICLYFAAIAIIFFARFPIRKDGRFRLMLVSALALLIVVLAQGADLAMESEWASQKIEVSTTRSAQRIAQVLQTQIDEVMDKGVTYDDIGSLDAYFESSAESAEAVDSFTLDMNNRVKALPSQTFIKENKKSVNRLYWAALGITAAAALVLLLAIFGLMKLCGYIKKQRAVQRIKKAEVEAKAAMSEEEIALENAQQLAWAVLEDDPIKNGLLLNRLKNGFADDIGVFGNNVRLRDTRDQKYMFAVEDYDSFLVLYITAMRKPRIFYINTDVFIHQLDSKRFHTLSLVQLVKNTPLDVPNTELEGYEYGTVTESDVPFVMQTYISPEFNQANINESLQTGPTVFVRHQGETIGYLITHRDGETGPMYLLPEHRGKRIGRELVLRMTKAVLETGDVPLANVERDNIACIRPHIEFGYEQPEREVVWVYEKSLGMASDIDMLMPKIGSDDK